MDGKPLEARSCWTLENTLRSSVVVGAFEEFNQKNDKNHICVLERTLYYG